MNPRRDGGWISVKDRLPEQGEIVDVWRDPVFGRPGRATDYKYVSSFKGDPNNNFWSPVGAGVMVLRDVTHWRHLPAPPQEANND